VPDANKEASSLSEPKKDAALSAVRWLSRMSVVGHSIT